MTESSGNQRSRRTGGHITKDRGPEEGDVDHKQGCAREHGLDGGAGGLESRQGREVKTRGGEVEGNGE